MTKIFITTIILFTFSSMISANPDVDICKRDHEDTLNECIFKAGHSYYYRDSSREVDKKYACTLWEIAGDMQHASAQYNAGNCYRSGNGRELNLIKAVLWYEKSPTIHSNEAKTTLASLYLFDLPELKKQSRAIELLKEANENGYLLASFNLGLAYYKGLGVKKNHRIAIKYYKIAANLGHILGSALLFHIYDKGLYGQVIDIKKSKHWNKQFVDNRATYFTDSWTINITLAVIYENGWGVEKNLDKAESYRSTNK